MSMLISCLTCDHPMSRPRDWQRPFDRATSTAQLQCAICQAVYIVEIRELRPSPRTPEEIMLRRNKTS